VRCGNDFACRAALNNVFLNIAVRFNRAGNQWRRRQTTYSAETLQLRMSSDIVPSFGQGSYTPGIRIIPFLILLRTSPRKHRVVMTRVCISKHNNEKQDPATFSSMLCHAQFQCICWGPCFPFWGDLFGELGQSPAFSQRGVPSPRTCFVYCPTNQMLGIRSTSQNGVAVYPSETRVKIRESRIPPGPHVSSVSFV
jgi:hypothetical protein